MKEDANHIVGGLSEDLCLAVADFFKVIGDATRIKILWILLKREMCVSELCQEIDMSQSAVSHQLRVLRQSKLVKNRKSGKEVYYSLDDDHVETLLLKGIHHIHHKK